ncbi:MAG: hypothetical protein DMG39_00420 [Acidobacteria bacterium]|nr:MAG: hypothetical protein DMG39_00420 [Acidobacteriota bacterium]
MHLRCAPVDFLDAIFSVFASKPFFPEPFKIYLDLQVHCVSPKMHAQEIVRTPPKSSGVTFAEAEPQMIASNGSPRLGTCPS